jgi:hypothetical protein
LEYGSFFCNLIKTIKIRVIKTHLLSWWKSFGLVQSVNSSTAHICGSFEPYFRVTEWKAVGFEMQWVFENGYIQVYNRCLRKNILFLTSKNSAKKQKDLKSEKNPILTNSLHPKSDIFPLCHAKKDSSGAQHTRCLS